MQGTGNEIKAGNKFKDNVPYKKDWIYSAKQAKKEMKTLIFMFIIAVLANYSEKGVFAQEETTSDTLRVKGMGVIFFEPDSVIFDSLSTGKESNLELLTDFRQYNERIIPFLKKKSIPYYKTNQVIFRIQMDNGNALFFKRTELGEIVGILLTDGIREPLILPGKTSDSDFFLKFRNYFEKK